MDASAYWRAGGQKLHDTVADLLASCDFPKNTPDLLYHFTDSTGLTGIFTTKTLWASLATALSDASETKYAVARLAEHLLDKTIQPKNIPAELLLKHLEGRRISGLISDSRAYVTSFCANADEALHWNHYGRSGTGMAIAFETKGLDADSWSLCPVIYEHSQQDRLLRTLVETVDEFAGKFIAQAATVRDKRIPIDSLAAHLTTMYLRLMAPRMKDPAFKAENEWRLIGNEVWEEGCTPSRQARYRTAAGRVVPYAEIKFEPLPITEIVLGASSAMQVDEQSLTVLMQNTLGRTYPVRRSAVAIRP